MVFYLFFLNSYPNNSNGTEWGMPYEIVCICTTLHVQCGFCFEISLLKCITIEMESRQFNDRRPFQGTERYFKDYPSYLNGQNAQSILYKLYMYIYNTRILYYYIIYVQCSNYTQNNTTMVKLGILLIIQNYHND